MIEIDNTIVSLDIIEKKFLCDLKTCKGACCVEGDSGAPLTDKEAAKIEEIYPDFKKYLSEKNIAEVNRQGFSIVDSDGDLVTPIIGDGECVYTFTDDEGVTKCAIERAWIAKEVDWQKPLSCSLFPIRITEYKRFDGLNYQQLDICKCGRDLGCKEDVPLWKFLEGPLTTKYGKEWYSELKLVAEAYTKQ